jgi:hypothetical protein
MVENVFMDGLVVIVDQKKMMIAMERHSLKVKGLIISRNSPLVDVVMTVLVQTLKMDLGVILCNINVNVKKMRIVKENMPREKNV